MSLNARSAGDLWPAVHAERAALADDLASLDDQGWASPTLCEQWSVEQVVAHLTAAATTGRLRWLLSMAAARFDPDTHNRRRLQEQLGDTPAATLARFRDVVSSTVAPTGHTAAWLGEVVVHAEDIRRPLWLAHTYPIEPLTAVANFYAKRDFAVQSATAARGLRLQATDGPFRVGEGPLATGPTLALVMALAGRREHANDLEGPGAELLRGRVE